MWAVNESYASTFLIAAKVLQQQDILSEFHQLSPANNCRSKARGMVLGAGGGWRDAQVTPLAGSWWAEVACLCPQMDPIGEKI
jgi:alkyl hydroperoxide reductase subunit AhpF